MSFPVYDEYKDCGRPWLGEVPASWDICSFRHCLTDVFNGLPATQIDEAYDSLPVTRIETISSGTIDESRLGFIASGDAREDRKLLFGDVLFSNINSLNMIGNCAIYLGGREIYAGMNLLVLRPANDCHPKWFYWLIRSGIFREVVESLAKPAINQASISQASLKAIDVPKPSIAEQKSIASFLDAETSKIDTLVSEQRRLIELLKEKRQAVISHAVTKGLNPNAPMKDSGIGWLGEVPEHWEVMAVHRLAREGHKTFTDGDWIERPYVTDSGVRLLQTGNVGIGHFKEQGFRYVSEGTFDELNCTELTPRDVLVCRLDGPVGRACLAPDLGVRLITSVDNAILKVRDDICPDYVVDVFTSKQWLSWIEAICRVGGGFRLRISRTMLGHQRFPVPPYEEQIEIAEFIDREQAKTDALAAEAERAIELLQERRTALISAAVTGKIDVRGFANGEML